MSTELLPGEGDIEVVTRIRVRSMCDVCGENPAVFKHTFLLENARRNPASRAYRRDDCSWCEDERVFVCEEHKNDRTPPIGYEWCSTFDASRLPHLFLYWRELKLERTIAKATGAQS